MAILSVTQLNRYVTFRLQEDAHLNGILVRGEISGFVRNQNSGHCYFTLKDAESSVSAVLFRRYAERIGTPLQNGMTVLAAASATLYERTGTFQLLITDLQPDGVGLQQQALEQRKRKLEAQGLFAPERKRSLPAFPRKIGVVTSASGAAIHDIEQVIRRRYPLVNVSLFPAQVQGNTAPESIVHAIRQAAAADCDVLIVGRGGGSKEDLQAFQTEAVVLAVANCPVPVISAVGHEIDQTLTDYAADLRAPTPSAAAELAVPEQEQLLRQIRDCKQRLYLAQEARIRTLRQQLREQNARLQSATVRLWKQKQWQLRMQQKALEGSNPFRILSNGYAVVSRGAEVIRSAKEVTAGEKLTIRLAEGTIQVVVTRN